ncbi:hypothetical protein GY45DRAFT_1261323 [Cubamyces sp. BRFM 1775]|nr:hypothetical protein GY45DRAFT_1261323 [Cubamyces sp. BRFM 1775]
MADNSLDYSGPPWYDKDEHGRIDVLAIPERLRTHPEIRRRGIVLAEPAKPGSVYTTFSLQDPQHAVKILSNETEERSIYEMLLADIRNPRNHTIPGELTETGYPLLIMPRLWDYSNLHRGREWTLHETLGYFLQVVEGVEYLHRRRIAHLDLCEGNIIVSGPEDEPYHEGVGAFRIFIIDFDSAQRFPLGPGNQPAISLPPTQMPPPNGLKHFDPYAWDVYCTGHILQNIMLLNYEERTPPQVVRWYVQWLIGSERGCTTVCHCRPTARRARQVLVLIRCAVRISELWVALFRTSRRLLDSRSTPE